MSKKIAVLDNFTLKVIAILAMLVDHVAVIFGSHIANDVVVQMRIVGRIAFPIFAFLLVQGFIHTSNRTNYLARLLGFGMGITLILAFLSSFGIQVPTQLNIFITLGIGFIAMWFIHEYWETSKLVTIIITGGILLAADLIHADYGAYGVATIVIFYITRNKKIWMNIGFIALTALTVFVETMRYSNASILQIYAIAALLLLNLYSGEKGKLNLKYFFYLFYPVHFVVLLITRYIMYGY